MELADLEMAERRQDVQAQALRVGLNRPRLLLGRDVEEPLLGVGGDRDLAVGHDGLELSERSQDLRRVLVRVLLRREERAMALPLAVAVVDLPEAAILPVANAHACLHRPHRIPCGRVPADRSMIDTARPWQLGSKATRRAADAPPLLIELDAPADGAGIATAR